MSKWDFYGNQIIASEMWACGCTSSSCDLVSCHKPSWVCSLDEDSQGKMCKTLFRCFCYSSVPFPRLCNSTADRMFPDEDRATTKISRNTVRPGMSLFTGSPEEGRCQDWLISSGHKAFHLFFLPSLVCLQPDSLHCRYLLQPRHVDDDVQRKECLLWVPILRRPPLLLYWFVSYHMSMTKPLP